MANEKPIDIYLAYTDMSYKEAISSRDRNLIRKFGGALSQYFTFVSDLESDMERLFARLFETNSTVVEKTDLGNLIDLLRLSVDMVDLMKPELDRVAGENKVVSFFAFSTAVKLHDDLYEKTHKRLDTKDSRENTRW